MRIILLIAFCGLFSFPSYSQTMPPPSPASDPLHRQLDFWIGDWEAFSADGVKRGDSHIELTLDSCVIVENWTSTGLFYGRHYSGKSYNTYNAAKEKWQQYWVDNLGGVTEYVNGHFEDGKMIYQTDPTPQKDGTTKIFKMTFFDLGPDKVRQFGQNSNDNGATWTTGFDLEYRRKK